MKAVRLIVVLAIALAGQTSLGRLATRDWIALDLVLVAVVYIGLLSGPGTAIAAGTIGGLVQDALSGARVIGIGSLAKSTVGYWAGVIGARFMVGHSLQRFVVFVVATVVHGVVYMGLYTVLDLSHFPRPWLSLGKQAVGNGLVGILVFQIAELSAGARRRRGQGGRRPMRL